MPPTDSSCDEELPKIRVCSAQISSIWENPEKTLSKAEQFIRHAARSGADICCFPEQFATGWDPESVLNVQQPDGPIVNTLRTFAADSNIAILGSFREASPQGPRNTAITIGNDGTVISQYSKLHLFSHARENEFFRPGTVLGTFSLGPFSCGIAICYDLRFPELFRIYARKGAGVIFVPAAWPENRIRHWELFIRARAAENQVYVVGVNTTGTTPVDKYAGASMTADPQGNIIGRAGESEQLIFSDLDLLTLEDTRRLFPVATDRKDELYKTLSNTVDRERGTREP